MSHEQLLTGSLWQYQASSQGRGPLPKFSLWLLTYNGVKAIHSRRMHMRNSGLWSFLRPRIPVHEPCGRQQQWARARAGHMITRAHNEDSMVGIAAKLGYSGSLWWVQFLPGSPGHCLDLTWGAAAVTIQSMNSRELEVFTGQHVQGPVTLVPTTHPTLYKHTLTT